MHQITEAINWIKSQAFPEGNHRFHVQTYPENIDTSSTITLKCYNNQNKERIISCRFSWSKSRNGIIVPLGYVRGNFYQCEPNDIGSIINVEVISLESQFPGTVILNFGPVRIDMLLRFQLEDLISRRQAKYSVIASSMNEQKELNIKITHDILKFQDYKKQQNFFKCLINFKNPVIQCHHKDLTRLSLKFSQQYHDSCIKFLSNIFSSDSIKVYKGNFVKLDLKFASFHLRNQFLFLHKSFIGLQHCSTLAILSQIQNLSVTHNQNFDYLVQVEILKDQFRKLAQINKQQSYEKQFYHSEVKRLQEEMELIIITYTKIVEQKFKNQTDLNNSYSILTNKRDQILVQKNLKLQKINQDYSKRIDNLTQQLNQRKQKQKQQKSNSTIGLVKKEAPFEQIQYRLHELSEINVKLTKENQKLRMMNQSQRDEKHLVSQNILDQLKLDEVEDNQGIKVAYQQIKKQLVITKNKNKELQFLLNKTEVIQGPVKQTSGLMHQSMFNKSSEYAELEKSFNKLKQQNKKLMQLRQYDKINHQAEMSRSKLEQSKQELSKSETMNIKQMNVESDIVALKIQVSALKQEIRSIKIQKAKLQQSNKVFLQQLKLLRKSQDILNKSRDFSMEMDNFYTEENNAIKEQNNMLVEQNEKLAKMCERYLGEGKEANRLRGQVITLRKQISQLRRKIEQKCQQNQRKDSGIKQMVNNTNE